MKNILSLLCMMLLAVCISSCGTKYARPDRCVCESVPAVAEQKPAVQEVAVQEQEPVQEEKAVEQAQEEPVQEVAQEKDNAIEQALQDAVKNNNKEFTIDFEKIAKQSLFKSGSDKISQDTYKSLDTVAMFLKENPSVTVTVEGHTDSTGSKAFNQTLSEKRAKAAANYLIEKGVDGSRISTKGYGPSKPIATNNTAEGRAQNRRTELKFKIGDVEQTQTIQNATGSAEVK